MNEREAFEAWFRTQPSACHTLRMSDHGPHAGEYIAIGVEREWNAWQAGRLAGFAEVRELAAKVCDQRVVSLNPTKNFPAFEVERILKDALKYVATAIRALKPKS